MKKEVNLEQNKSELEKISIEQIMKDIFEKVDIGSKGSNNYYILNPYEDVRKGLLERIIAPLLSNLFEQQDSRPSNEITTELILQLYQMKIEINKFLLEKMKITIDYYSTKFMSSATSRIDNLYREYSTNLLNMIKRDEEIINNKELLKESTKKRILDRKAVNH